MPFGPVRVRVAVDAAPDAAQIASAGEQVERAWAEDSERARKEVSTESSDEELEEE